MHIWGPGTATPTAVTYGSYRLTLPATAKLPTGSEDAVPVTEQVTCSGLMDPRLRPSSSATRRLTNRRVRVLFCRSHRCRVGQNSRTRPIRQADRSATPVCSWSSTDQGHAGAAPLSRPRLSATPQAQPRSSRPMTNAGSHSCFCPNCLYRPDSTVRTKRDGATS